MDVTEKKIVRLPQIDIFRGIAVILVLWHHCYVHSGVHYPVNAIFGATSDGDGRNLLGSAYMGVDLFFLLSGFCLSWPYFVNDNRKLNWITFIKRRLLRVYPAFTVSFLLLIVAGWLIRFFVKDDRLWPLFAQPVSWFRLISGYLLQTTEMNGSYWSLCLELRWYILFPLFLLLARRFNPWYLVAASLAACAAIPQGVPLHGPLKVPVYLPLLFAGVAVAQTFAQQERLEYRSLVRYAGLGFCFCLGLICLILPGPFDPGRGTFAEVLPTTAFFSFLVLMGLQWQKLNFLGRCLESIGICSYSLYLVHQPLIELLRFALHTDSWTSPWALGYSLLILPLVAIACGYLFFKMFEQPFLDLGKSNPAKTAAVPQLPEGKY